MVVVRTMVLEMVEGGLELLGTGMVSLRLGLPCFGLGSLLAFFFFWCYLLLCEVWVLGAGAAGLH